MTFYLEVTWRGQDDAGAWGAARAGLRRPVRSPTYTLAETYTLPAFELHHFDLYRMHVPREWMDAGFRDCERQSRCMLIEWPEKGGAGCAAADLKLR